MKLDNNFSPVGISHQLIIVSGDNVIQPGIGQYLSFMSGLLPSSNLSLSSFCPETSNSSLNVPKPEVEKDADESVKREDLCKVCITRRRNCMIEDCKHIHFCVTCVRKLLIDRFGNKIHGVKCPLCNTIIKKGASRIFL